MLRSILNIIELTVLSVLILTTRSANFPDVFVAGDVYFTDADCYARMTRVRMCSEHPALIVRHHDFENFPTGTTPHTTAPLDYLILTLAIFLRPFTPHATDMAGALVSPLVALLGGWFLWWWSKRMKFRYRWVMLSLYAISPILVHATELGRPDHQSLLVLLITIALCAEWSRVEGTDTNFGRWSLISGIAWGLAIWTSAYESLVLFLLATAVITIENPKAISAKSSRAGWLCFVFIIVIAFLIERRAPSFSGFYLNPLFQNWTRTIGELVHVSPANPIWLRWTGYLLLVTPFLIWISVTKTVHKSSETIPTFLLVVLVATCGLTIWQARWSYFFVLIFALALPRLLESVKPPSAVWIAFLLSLFPILRDWEERLWPNEAQLANRVERRSESAELRHLALSLRSSEIRPFLAPWWFSPSIAYWSGQPGIAGSSHESLSGIADSARVFLCDDWEKARQILENHQTAWVVAYDFERVAQNSSAVLDHSTPANSLCRVLDRAPTHAPPFLIFAAQNGAFKLYRTIAR